MKYCNTSTYRKCRFWQKKNHLSRWSLFWSWRLCNQAKLSHLSSHKTDWTTTTSISARNYSSRKVHIPLQIFSQDYGLVSHTTHVVCFYFICEWLNQQFNVESEWQIFFDNMFISSQSFCHKCAKRKSPKQFNRLYCSVLPSVLFVNAKNFSLENTCRFFHNTKRHRFLYTIVFSTQPCSTG